MVKKIQFLFLLITVSASSQDLKQAPLLSNNIARHIKGYKIESQLAFHDKQFNKAEALFDSLVKNVISGSRMDNFTSRKLSGRKVEFDTYKKPVFLMTYASWCTPGVGEIPALNDVAKKYNTEIDFVVLFWDKKSNAKKASRKINSKIDVLYIDEAENKYSRVIRMLKHSVGFPSSFFINHNDIIIGMRRGRGELHPYEATYEKSYTLNYNAFSKGISILINSTLSKEDYSSQNK